MQAIIHIGAEKTGTTFLQASLDRNRSRLARSGTLMPLTPGRMQHSLLAFRCGGESPSKQTFRNTLAKGQSRAEWNESFDARLHQEILDGRKAGRTRVLLTSELLQSHLQRPSEVLRLKWLLDRDVDSYVVVFYMRRQDRLQVSRYSTFLRGGASGEGPLRDAQVPAMLDFERTLELWAGVFGQDAIVPRVYEDACKGDGLLADFARACGLAADTAKWEVPERKNEALSSLAQNYLSLHNATAREAGLGRIQAREVAGTLIGYLQEALPGKPLLPGRDEASAYLAPFLAANQRIARRWFGRDTLFDDDFSEYPEAATDAALDMGTVIRTAAGLYEHLLENAICSNPARLRRLESTAGARAFLDGLADQIAEAQPVLSKRLRQIASAVGSA